MAGSVLLIDDDVDVLRSIGNYFERLAYEVTRELSGEAGLATFDRLRPEVVILDLRLPGMDGMEVLEHLRQRDAAVILLTGESDVATAVRAMQLGAENFLTKPVDMEHLAAATARVADKARLRRINEALLVQSAPGHGLDDYNLGLQHGLPIYSPVDDDGCFTYTSDLPIEQQMPAEMIGKLILEKHGKSDANEAVRVGGVERALHGCATSAGRSRSSVRHWP